ncbi:hypothetical protein [Nonomuraea ceibae]|uniref:hypothetical protein n=1 Tax=Nonomuraea ceibae TaxID=1935170 RepID=UPI001C5E7041|nr:hypothetical protein [Nonomuraea ceibae]
MRARKHLPAGIAAAALLAAIGMTAPAAATSGSICLYSGIQSVCVTPSPGYIPLAREITSARNSSPYAARLVPAEGVNIGCLQPGETETYSQPRKISGIRVYAGGTCPL